MWAGKESVFIREEKQKCRAIVYRRVLLGGKKMWYHVYNTHKCSNCNGNVNKTLTVEIWEG